MARWKPDPKKSEQENEWSALMAATAAHLRKKKPTLKADKGTFYDIYMDALLAGYEKMQELKKGPKYQPEKYSLFNTAYYAVWGCWSQAVAKNLGAHTRKDGGIVYDVYAHEEDARDAVHNHPQFALIANELHNTLNYMSDGEKHRRSIMKRNKEQGRKQKFSSSIFGREIMEEEAGGQYLDYVDDCAEFGIKPLSRKEFERGRLDRKMNPGESSTPSP